MNSRSSHERAALSHKTVQPTACQHVLQGGPSDSQTTLDQIKSMYFYIQNASLSVSLQIKLPTSQMQHFNGGKSEKEDTVQVSKKYKVRSETYIA